MSENLNSRIYVVVAYIYSNYALTCVSNMNYIVIVAKSVSSLLVMLFSLAIVVSLRFKVAIFIAAFEVSKVASTLVYILAFERSLADCFIYVNTTGEHNT